ncbi:MAG: response regulator [Deltaproteobacteria bacterium]|nr:response regulator [Deltaproteobacteria bacterium]
MGRKTILLVEDNAGAVQLSLIAFKESAVPCNVVVMLDGVEALDYIFAGGKYRDKQRAMPEVILLDLKLPGMSGHEVLKKIREAHSTRLIPIIIFSVSNEETDRKICYELGANSYIKKPVDFEKYIEIVRMLGNYWLKLNEPPPRTAQG